MDRNLEYDPGLCLFITTQLLLPLLELLLLVLLFGDRAEDTEEEELGWWWWGFATAVAPEDCANFDGVVADGALGHPAPPPLATDCLEYFGLDFAVAAVVIAVPPPPEVVAWR